MQNLIGSNDGALYSLAAVSQAKKDTEAQIKRLNQYLGDCDQINRLELSSAGKVQSVVEDLQELGERLQGLGDRLIGWMGWSEELVVEEKAVPTTPKVIRQIEYDQQEILKLSEHRNRIHQIYETLERKVSKYSARSSAATENQLNKLLVLEKEFEIARLNFTACKCQLLSPLPKALDAFAEMEGIEELKGQIESELAASEMESIQGRIAEIESRMSALKLQINLDKEEILEQLSKAYLPTLQSIYEGLEQQYHAHIASMGKFLELPINQENSGRLECSKNDVLKQLRNYQEGLQELKNHLAMPKGNFNPEYLESGCKNLRLHLNSTILL